MDRKNFVKNSIHLLITGRPGVGKTTLIKGIIKSFLKKGFRLDGFYTEEMRENGKRVGFRIMNVEGKEKGILSRIGFLSSYRIGKYRVNVNKIDETVEKIKKVLNSRKIDILIIDEIGPMELYSRNFKSFIISILKGDTPIVIGTIKEKCLHLLNNWGVGGNVEVKKITVNERKTFNILAGEIVSRYSINV